MTVTNLVLAGSSKFHQAKNFVELWNNFVWPIKYFVGSTKHSVILSERVDLSCIGRLFVSINGENIQKKCCNVW